MKNFFSPSKLFIRLIKYYGSEFWNLRWNSRMNICNIPFKVLMGLFGIMAAIGLGIILVGSLLNLSFVIYNLNSMWLLEDIMIFWGTATFVFGCILFAAAISLDHRFFPYTNAVSMWYDSWKNNYCFMVDFSKFDK